MIRIFSTLSFLVFWLCAQVAQAQEPKVLVTAEQEDVVLGQPYILRVEILVPTFMPKAPIFPTFEVPGLLVRLPERSTSPISERIDGNTWAGVRRTYRIYPMRAGVTEIPPQKISIVYKDKATNEDISIEVDVPATTIVATVPPGARTLDPIILAKGLSIEQSWQVGEGQLEVGDALIRQLEISVAGASALFVPPLLAEALPQGGSGQREDDEAPVADFVPYPDDAVVNESVDREGMSGSREEKITYVAQSGGTVEFPEIILEWYNLEMETVEKIVLAGRTFDVALKQGNRVQIDPQASRRVALYLMAMSALFWSVHRWCWPVLKPKIAALRSAYDKSVFAAHRQAVRAAVSRDLSGLMKALETLKSLGRAPSEPLNVAVRELTRAVYRNGKSGDATRRYWQEVHDMLRQDRPGVLPSLTRGGASLEPLNPFS